MLDLVKKKKKLTKQTKEAVNQLKSRDYGNIDLSLLRMLATLFRQDRHQRRLDEPFQLGPVQYVTLGGAKKGTTPADRERTNEIGRRPIRHDRLQSPKEEEEKRISHWERFAFVVRIAPIVLLSCNCVMSPSMPRWSAWDSAAIIMRATCDCFFLFFFCFPFHGESSVIDDRRRKASRGVARAGARGINTLPQAKHKNRRDFIVFDSCATATSNRQLFQQKHNKLQ